MKFSGKFGNGPLNKRLNFGGDPDHSGYKYCFPFSSLLGDTDSPDGGTGKTCLGGGMHCPSASSFVFFSLVGTE